jgi:copper chaperone NosL
MGFFILMAALREVKGARGVAMKLRNFLARETKFFELPLTLTSRLLILVAVVALLPIYFFPLWNMSFFSNQYTDGLVLHIYSYQLEGGKTPNRDDLREINSLNHYIGMRPLLESDFSEFNWIPLVVGLLIILALRAMVLGKMSNLVDVFVMFVYFGAFSMWSFYHRLYMYAHNLDPTASIKVPPFTPPFFGSKQIANFTVNSFPGIGAYAFFAFAILLLVAILLSAKRKSPEARRAISLDEDV